MVSYNTRKTVMNLAQTDPELHQHLLSDAAQKNPFLSVSFRQLEAFFKRAPEPNPPTSAHEFTLPIPMRDGHKSQIRVFKPIRTPEKSPLVVLIHGGGFVVGHNSHLSAQARALTSLCGATVVSISYRLAPEFKFPTALNDIRDTIGWLCSAEDDNSASLGADLDAGFIIGGLSAGASMAAVVSQEHMAKHVGSPITGVWLAIPLLLDPAMDLGKYQDLFVSREQNADALFLNKAALDFIHEAYAPDVLSADFSPVNAKNVLGEHPPTYIQVCGQDPLRDDGLIYSKMLQERGTNVKLDVYPGVPHGHDRLFPKLESSVKCNLDTMRGIGWLLGQTIGDEDSIKALASAELGLLVAESSG